MMLPQSLSTITDAHNAMQRLVGVFTSEDLSATFEIDPMAPHALSVIDAEFEWETSGKTSTATGKGSKRKGATNSSKDSKKVDRTLVEPSSPPSRLTNISLEIPRGQLWMVCGPVGSGKSSLLQGLIGEMRKTKGEVVFGE